MDFDGLTEDQKAKAKNCNTPEEILELAQKEGYQLSIDELEGAAGGADGWKSSGPDSPCNDDCKLQSCGTFVM